MTDEKHTKKTWLEERINLFDRFYQDGSRNYTDDTLREISTEVCKKLLDEVKNNCFKSWMPQVSDDVYNVLKNVIKNLGVEV